MAYQNHNPSIQTSDVEAPEITPTNHSQETKSFTAKYAVHKVKQNLIFRSKWAEINGAMGDLGTVAFSMHKFKICAPKSRAGFLSPIKPYHAPPTVD
ncbi:unnamed protein product [Trifolium pratense]|uniref:Uncharacterized protein n=1 Tax=Trifolium pratense TaxID=57577 RepID=A0ACB0M2S4_TRIPR|nr:unnamed protein product [Trifolium pratense]